MLTGSDTVTRKSPVVATGTWCIGICLENPRTPPNSVAEVADEPQRTCNLVEVPGADGFGVTLILGTCDAMAGVAPTSIRPTSSAPQAQHAPRAELSKRTAPPDGYARTSATAVFPARPGTNSRRRRPASCRASCIALS